MAGYDKIDKAEYSQRVNKVFDLLVAGGYNYDIVKDLADSEGWNVSQRQLYYYINAATKLFEKHASVIQKKEFGKAMARYNKMMWIAMEKRDVKAALAVQQDINRMLGLYPD